jgi:peptidoglycan/LPS O-acetylase OafA/YrhL
MHSPGLPTTASSRITQLDGVRALAIASVFIHHAFKIKLLWMGVDLFFVLSGFLITGILLDERRKPFGEYIGGFYTRRARRILPPYVAILIITALIFGVGWLRYWYLYIGAMNFLMPLRLTTPNTLPLWSLAVEEQFYLLWPVAVYYLSRKHLTRCVLALLLLAPILRCFCTPLFTTHWAVYMLLPFRMDTLAAGALIAIMWPELQKTLNSTPNLKWVIGGSCAAVIAMALLSIRYLGRHGFTTDSNTAMGNFGVYEATLAIVASIFIVALIGIGKKVLSSWPLMWLGRISYSIYLIHLTALYLAPKSSAFMTFVAAAAGTLVYATAMWFLVEKPILNAGHPRTKELVTACAAQ